MTIQNLYINHCIFLDPGEAAAPTAARAITPVSHRTYKQSVFFFGAHVNRLEHSHRTQCRAETLVPR